MEYLVIGADGQEYGPANVETLKEWVADNRVGADTNLKEFHTGRVVPARSVPFLFAPVASPPIAGPPPGGIPIGDYRNPPTSYPRPGYSAPGGSSSGNSDIIWAIGRSVLALVFFFFLRGVGLIIGIYGLIYAIRGYQSGHRFGVAAVVVSVVTLIILAVGWFFRLSQPSY